MNSSSFNKTTYRAANDRIINMIKQTHDWQSSEGFIADGVICPDEYEKQPVRILCILAESYGYNECGYNDGEVPSIEDQPTKDVLGLTNGSVKAPRNLATMLWLIQRSFELGRKETWDDMPYLFSITKENTIKLQSALSKVAWINVKKASNGNGTGQDSEEVYAHALRNRDILRDQINVIAPHLIIVCGQVVFRALYDMKLIGTEVAPDRKWEVQAVNGGPHVLEVTHPRSWWGYEKLYENFEHIYSQLVGTDGKPSATFFRNIR